MGGNNCKCALFSHCEAESNNNSSNNTNKNGSGASSSPKGSGQKEQRTLRRGAATTNAPYSRRADGAGGGGREDGGAGGGGSIGGPSPPQRGPSEGSSCSRGSNAKDRAQSTTSVTTSIHIGETGRRRRTLEEKYRGDPKVQVLIEEELASRATILSEYELEANRISNRHPLSPMSIATYSTEKHLVFIRHGKAYDATSWFETHPGGKFVLLKYAGQDVSEVFDRFHSRRTKNELIKEVYIGKVWTGRGVATCGLHGYGSDCAGSGAGSCAGSNPSHSPNQSGLLGHHSHHYHASSTAGGTGHTGYGFSGIASMLSPIGSDLDRGDFEGRVVRIKPLTRDGSVIRIFIAFPERLACELGGSIVIKHKGTARNYSPCFIEETNFSLVVKRYDKGLVSNFIFSKRIGDCLEFDGPYVPKALVPDKPFKTLLLIGQGTGVVPVLEVARTVLAETIFFVSCYSTISDVLFSKELSLLPDSVRLIYFIPRANPATDASLVPGLLYKSRFTVERLRHAMGVAGGSTMTSLSGVDIMGNSLNNSIAGGAAAAVAASAVASAGATESAAFPPPPPAIPLPSIECAMVCGSFTFFDDVHTMLVSEMGLPRSAIIQL